MVLFGRSTQPRKVQQLEKDENRGRAKKVDRQAQQLEFKKALDFIEGLLLYRRTSIYAI